ncbi:hypothetical protein NHX12_010111 [Muraenolepis orangiensis]|uniref:Serine-threonine/tyrosine-protein kinase catalytic domain-containing protein n=1 Tax=Muraenolepis orangiensis TaxID=630683 RepID=A0A9Q0DLL2_9TELE|nr:hypothetical protein NHX12_010111 [Muraenolepis orangiensis]
MRLPFPCPVRLGDLRSDGQEAQFHRHAMEKNLTKMEKLLRKEAVAELLLQYRADPNHRCEDWSTPVHAAVFSGNPWLLSCLLDSGGDLRLHDQEDRVPVDWLIADTQEHGVCEMAEFLKRCASHVQHSYQSPGIRELNQSPHFISTSSQCFGFGKVCVDKPCQSLGVLASIPVIRDSDLTQAEDETLSSFKCGSFISMTNYSWKGSRVTVKQIKASKVACKDLLLTELDYCSQLFHPHLLQLMAVSLSADLLETSLVFERVHVDSLHNLLHHKRAEYPVLRIEWLLPLLLQACEGVVHLHSRGLWDVPPSLYNWAAPEVVRRRKCTEKADLYSLCAIIQELCTDMVPWGEVEQRWIKQVIEEGQALQADSRIPEPYYALVQVGLRPRASDRTKSVQDLCYTLRSEIKRLSQDGKLSFSGECENTTAAPDTKFWQVTHSGDPVLAGQRARQEPVQHGQIESEKRREVKMIERAEEHEDGDGPQTSMLHPDVSVQGALPLDECRAYPAAPPAHYEGSIDSNSAEDDLEPEMEVAGEIVVPTGGLGWSRVRRERIGSIVLNLKVCQVLLQQGNASLDVVERYHLQNRKGNDEVDFGEANPAKPSEIWTAVGPPFPSYCPQPHPPTTKHQEQVLRISRLSGRDPAISTADGCPGPGHRGRRSLTLTLHWSCNVLRCKTPIQRERCTLLPKVKPPNSAELAEVSSITGTPARVHHRLPQASLSRRPCSSTPRGLAYWKSNPLGAVGNTSLESPRVQFTAMALDSESFTTAVDVSGDRLVSCPVQSQVPEHGTTSLGECHILSSLNLSKQHNTGDLWQSPAVNLSGPAGRAPCPGPEPEGDGRAAAEGMREERHEGETAGLVCAESDEVGGGGQRSDRETQCVEEAERARPEHRSTAGPPRPRAGDSASVTTRAYWKSNPLGAVGNTSLESPRVQFTAMALDSESFTTAVDVSGDRLVSCPVQSQVPEHGTTSLGECHILSSLNLSKQHNTGDLWQSPAVNLSGPAGRAPCPGPEPEGDGRAAAEGMREERHEGETAGLVCAESDEVDAGGQRSDRETQCVEEAERARPEHRSTAGPPRPRAGDSASVTTRGEKNA